MSNIFTHKTLQNGIDLYICPTNKFKTISIYFFLHQNLKSETATKTAIALCIKEGIEKFSTSAQYPACFWTIYTVPVWVEIF